jgi:DNA helicase HerA-like ATPase
MSNQLEKENINFKMLELIDYTQTFLEKGYLSERSSYEILEPSRKIKNINFSKDIRISLLDRFVYDEKENNLDKLENIFTGLYGNGTSVFLLLESNGKKCDFYMGVRDTENVVQGFTTLESSLSGNFPGISMKEKITTSKVTEIIERVTGEDLFEITTISGIPSLKSEDENNFVQGIGKLIDGMEGREFSAIMIADPIAHTEVKRSKKAYENLYTQLHPFLSTNLSLNKSEAQALTKGWGDTFTKNYSENLSATETTNSSVTKGHNRGESTTVSGSLGLIGSGVGFLLGGPAGMIVGGMVASQFGNVSKTNNSGESNSETEGRSDSNTKGETYGESKSKQNNESNTETLTSGKTLQITNKNKTIENLLKRIEKNIERLECAEGSGMWNVGTYFLSNNPQNSVTAANMYNGLIRGDESSLEKCGVYSFKKNSEIEMLKDYLYNFSNPIIQLNNKNIDIKVSMGSLVSNKELPLKLNFPKKSVAGLEVIEMSSFGRNQKLLSVEKSIEVGKMYHLGNESEIESRLDVESLASHTFVTGSTGAGKSNTVYTLLDELYKKDIKLMVVEPAKGEYKDVFGGRKDFEVYGTNKKYTKLLRLNPFSFNDEIHVLEHIDRLIEIFNACWPMYAAMPSILKDAVERAYKSVGWDLTESVNLFGENIYPDFKLLKNSLENIINSSSFSDEVKSNYLGALVTRVNSMANGLIGQIFSQDELSEEELFDNNVIADISRIPSMETKSLIMGILFTKLHEYRMSQGNRGNSKLKHVTVLEEAHNLLKKTSSSQSQEGANLQGKSVEMLTNAIAEMRTYGEGFIIADQAPGLLDEAVIRNTNTKICLRLPSLGDRELVGRSMNLSDEQIKELARLETGVAAVYQNNWTESILVKFNHMNNPLEHNYIPNNNDKKLMKESLRYLLNKRLPRDEGKILIENESEIHGFLVEKGITYSNENLPSIDKAIHKLVEGDKIWEIVNAVPTINISEWNSKCELIINNILNTQNEKFYRMEVINSIIREEASKNNELHEFHNEWNDFARKVLRG